MIHVDNGRERYHVHADVALDPHRSLEIDFTWSRAVKEPIIVFHVVSDDLIAYIHALYA